MVVEDGQGKSTDSLAKVTAQFRKDPRLPPEAKAAIEATVKVLYAQFAIAKKAK